MTAALPDFDALWAHFPQGGDDEVRQAIGGAVAANPAAEAAALRISRAFNEAKHPIPEGQPQLATATGADGKHYALRLAEFRAYMTEKFGPPDESMSSPGGAPPTMTGRKGVLYFEVASGPAQIDLWNGSQCRLPDLFPKAAAVHFWTNKEDELRREVKVKDWEKTFRAWTETADGRRP